MRRLLNPNPSGKMRRDEVIVLIASSETFGEFGKTPAEKLITRKHERGWKKISEEKETGSEFNVLLVSRKLLFAPFRKFNQVCMNDVN